VIGLIDQHVYSSRNLFGPPSALDVRSDNEGYGGLQISTPARRSLQRYAPSEWCGRHGKGVFIFNCSFAASHRLTASVCRNPEHTISHVALRSRNVPERGPLLKMQTSRQGSTGRPCSANLGDPTVTSCKPPSRHPLAQARLDRIIQPLNLVLAWRNTPQQSWR